MDVADPSYGVPPAHADSHFTEPGRNQAAVLAGSARAFPSLLLQPLAEVSAPRSIGFAQQQFASFSQMLAPKPFQRFPLEVVVENIGAHDQIILHWKSIRGPIDTAYRDLLSPRPSVPFGERQCGVGGIDHPNLGAPRRGSGPRRAQAAAKIQDALALKITLENGASAID